MLTIVLAWLVWSIPPRVEDPFPDSIGLGLPFVLAGAAGVLMDVIYADSPTQKRNRIVRLAGRAGFWIGIALYILSLAIQVASRL